MMKVYPIFLNDLSKRRCVVIGGGREAERKVAGLLDCEAQVTVISAAVTEPLREWAAAGRIAWLDRDYRAGDLKGAFLVICEGNRPEQNSAVWQEGEAEGTLVNVMDDIPHCNFVAGSVVRQGPLVISISTSGAAPTLAVRLRQKLEQEIGPEYADFLTLAQALREPMAARYPSFSERRDRWYQLVDSDILQQLRTGHHDAARQLAVEICGVEVEDNGHPQDVPADHLVTTEWMEANLNDPSIRLIEIGVDTAAYETEHLPGAIAWIWSRDVMKSVSQSLPDQAAFEKLLARSSISSDTTVILYGDNDEGYAVEAFRLFKYYGHDDVRLMKGGRRKWLAEERPLG